VSNFGDGNFGDGTFGGTVVFRQLDETISGIGSVVANLVRTVTFAAGISGLGSVGSSVQVAGVTGSVLELTAEAATTETLTVEASDGLTLTAESEDPPDLRLTPA
jgi:hypothetical protein